MTPARKPAKVAPAVSRVALVRAWTRAPARDPAIASARMIGPNRPISVGRGPAGAVGIRRLVGQFVPATGVDQPAKHLDQEDGKREGGHQNGDETYVAHVRTIPAWTWRWRDR